ETAILPKNRISQAVPSFFMTAGDFGNGREIHTRTLAKRHALELHEAINDVLALVCCNPSIYSFVITAATLVALHQPPPCILASLNGNVNSPTASRDHQII